MLGQALHRYSDIFHAKRQMAQTTSFRSGRSSRRIWEREQLNLRIANAKVALPRATFGPKVFRYDNKTQHIHVKMPGALIIGCYDGDVMDVYDVICSLLHLIFFPKFEPR